VAHSSFVRRLRLLSGLLALLALNLGTIGAASHLAVPASTLASSPSTVSADGGYPTLVLDPGAWWTVAGNTTRLAATWTGVPAGCTSAPTWYRWSVVAGWAEGLLAPSDGPSANFTSATMATGTARIEASSATIIVCGAAEFAVHQNATANVTVEVPPEVDGLLAYPDPVLAGGVTELTGTLSGGEPPYRVRVAWGDGNVSTVDLSVAGTFALPERFPPGNFSPSVMVEDSAGLSANASVEEPVYASVGFAIGIETVSPVAEVGVPVEFTGAILDPPSAFSELSSCSDIGAEPAVEVGHVAANVSFSCTFSTPGIAEVEYEVVPSGDDLPAAQAELVLPVTGILALQVGLDGPPGEVGRLTVASADLIGGVPPFVIEWQLSSNASGQQQTLTRDGTAMVPVWPSEAGTFGLSVRVTDSTGTEVANGTVRCSIDPALDASAAVGGMVGTGGSVLSVSGAVPQGTAPFDWFVAPARVPSNETPSNGTLTTVSGFSWTGTLPFEGSSFLTVGVVDAGGSFWWTTLGVDLVPTLSVASVLRCVTTNDTATLALGFTVRGGLPPLEVWTNLSDGTSRNESLSADGTFSGAFAVNRSGWAAVNTTVVDALGVRTWSNVSENVSLASTPASPPSNIRAAGNDSLGSATIVAGASTVAIGLAAVVAFLWRKRPRDRSPVSLGPDPVSVLRQIIEPADGADRATVELMAEESGVPLAIVRSSLDRLIAEGTVRAETGPDGEEVVAWSRLGPP
jgi:hypothetical protein